MNAPVARTRDPDRCTAGASAPFEIVRGAPPGGPLVFASPHSGRIYPAGMMTASRLDAARTPLVQERYQAFTQEAIDTSVFGAPTYVVDGEMFWGQDRLDFVERALAR